MADRFGAPLSLGSARAALDRYGTLLKQNIIPTPQLLQELVTCRVFNETTIGSFKNISDRMELNTKMLELLAIHGLKAILNFPQALHKSGHVYFADLLQTAFTSQVSKELSDAFHAHMPSSIAQLLGDLDQSEEDQLVAYINTVTDEAVVRQQWESGDATKEKALDAKQRQLEESWKISDLLKDRDRLIQETQHSLIMARENAIRLTEELKDTAGLMKEMKEKHEGELFKQMKLSESQDRILQRLTLRQQEMDKQVEVLLLRVTDFLSKQQRSTSDYSSREPVYYKETSLTNLEKLTDLLSHVTQSRDATDDEKKRCADLEQEKRYVLSKLKEHNKFDENNLRRQFDAYAKKNHTTITCLREKTRKLTEKLNEAKNCHEQDVADAQAMQETIQALQKELRAKEGQLNKAVEEKAFLRVQMNGIKRGASSIRRPPTPDNGAKIQSAMAANR